MNDDIDTEVLISVVETRSILWDKSQDFYKDRNGIKKGWEAVCIDLKSNFNNLQNQDNGAFLIDVES